MGKGIRLSGEEWDAIDNLRLRTPSPAVFRNCLIILQSNLGEKVATIADFLHCDTETVKRVRRLYRSGGIKALQPIKPPGRKSRATPEYIKEMREAVLTSPLNLGYAFSNWSSARLAAHLKKVTGISLSEDQLRRVLHREGFSVHRPKHTMKGKRDEQAYQKAQKQLRVLKKTP